MDIHDFDYLFEDYVGVVLQPDEDFDDIPMEAIQESIRANHQPKVGEVWKARMPYLNFRKGYSESYKNRPVVILKTESGKLFAVRMSGLKHKNGKRYWTKEDDEKDKQKLHTRYEVELKDWIPEDDSEVKVSYAVGTDCRLLEYAPLEEKLGELSKRDFAEVQKRFNNFVRDREDSPFKLMDWMKFVNIDKLEGSFDQLPMQDIKSFLDTNKGNSIDICTAVQHVMLTYNRTCVTVASEFSQRNGKSHLHFHCLFMGKGDRGNEFRSFRFMPGDPAEGTNDKLGTGNPEKAAHIESEWLRRYFEFPNTTVTHNYVLTMNDIVFWKNAVESHTKQSDLIEHLNDEGAITTKDSGDLFFFHMVPKGTDVSEGLLAPAAMSKLGMQEELKKSLDKYRERMVKGWRIYPDKLPEELNETELIQGLEKFRGEGGSRAIYFFRYPPTEILGKNMSDILKEKDIYRINLNDPRLQRYIERIDWGNYGSNTDNKAFTRDYYENISEKDYFSEYNDNPADGIPLFASIPHIGVIFKNGICPKQFLSLVTKASDVTTESVTSQIFPGDVVPGYPTRIFVKDLGDGSYCFDDTEVNMRMRTLNDKENGYTIDNLEANFAKYVPESVEVVDENEPAMEAAKYIDKKLTYSEVKDGIQYIFSDDGIANSYYEIDGEKYRVRVETIVKREVNGTSCVFFEKKDKETHYGTMYKLPGGSVEIDKSLAEQAECEVNEEILCKVKNVHYTGKYYIVKYDKNAIPEWHKRILWPIGLKYVGAISFVFTAEYDGPYKKKVDEKDKDSLAQKGDWYPIWEFEEIKSDVHQGIALESMESVTEASIYTQKYKDFDEFCEYIQTPEEVATWYSRNHVNWPPGETGSDHPFRWPDSIVKHKIGNCYDHALFMHYFCDRKGIPNKQVHSYVILVRRDEKTGKVDFDYCGHIVTLFEKDGCWYEFDPQPHRQKSGTVIEGPFDSIDEYLDDMSEGLELLGRQMNVGYETKSGYYVYSEDEQKVWDKFYNAPIKDRDVFHAKYLSNDNTYEEYKKGKMKPVEQKRYFEYLRVRAAILKFIIRHGIRKMKDEVVSFFNESSNVDAFINHMEVVEESFTTKDNIIPVDYSGYDGIDTRIICLNTHCLNGLEQVIPLTGLFALLGQPLLGSLIEISAWTAYALSDQIFAVDIFAVDKNINIRNDCEGLPIIACNDGTVVDSVNDVDNELGTVDRMIHKYGNYVVISHDNGRWFSVYAHLRKGSVIVKAGNKVRRGQKIAELGHSGNSDAKASHLHFEMLWTNVMAKNRPSLLLDLPKTLSGFGEYECTRIPWGTAAQIWIPFNKIEGLKQAYKEPMQSNTSGELSGACFLTETPDKTVEEVYLPIMESAKQFKSSKAKNFEDFCNECKTPEDAMNWFIANKVVWNDKANDDNMRWPDTLVKERKGNCLDQSVMIHFFFKKRHIEHRMALFTIRLENGSTAGHIFPLFKRGKYVYAWLYIGPGHGVITGPYKSWYDAAGQVTEFYKVLILSSPKKQFDSPVSDTTEWSVQEYSETEHLDKYLNKDIVQKDYLYADGGDNLWSTHFFSRDFRFIRIPKISGVLYKLLAWSKQYQTPKEKKVAKEAMEIIKSEKYIEPVKESTSFDIIHPTPGDIEAKEFIKSSFTDEEKQWFGSNNDESPDNNPDVTVFCKVEYDNETPCAYVNLTDSGKLGLAEGDVNISFGVHKDYRKRGLAVKLIKDAVHWFKSTNYTTMSFIVRKGNEASYKLAERCGFTFMQYWEKTKEYWFMITNPSMLKAIGESAFIGNEQVVQEEYKLSVYIKQYKTLDDFCKVFKTFDEVTLWFQANHVKWPDYKESNKYGPLKWTGEVHWPEDLLRDKIGNCFDQALFVYYFCKKHNIPARMYRFSLFYDKEGITRSQLQCTSHFVTMVQRKPGIFIFSYQGRDNDTSGPYPSYEKAVERYEKWFCDIFQMTIFTNRDYYQYLRIEPDKKKSRIKVKIGYFTEDDMKFFDMTYGDKHLTQNEYVKKSKGCVFPEDGKVIEHTLFELFLNKASSVVGNIGNRLSDFISSKESVEQPDIIKEDHTDLDVGICDHVLKYLGNSIDIQKFADIKSGRRFMYTRCKIMKKDIPLVLLLAYCEGLTTVLRKAEINFSFSDTRPRLKEMEAVRKGVIPFADGYLVYEKFPLEVSLLMNGFGMVDTRGFDYAEMDGKDVYVSLFDILFGTRMLANALDNFYDWMIDPVTFQVLEDLNYPTDFVGLLLAGNKLLADNSFTNELDMRNYRIRSNEMAYAYAFKAISEAYGKFRMTAGNKNPSKISIPQGMVIKDIMQSQVVEDVSELSPIVEVEKQHLCTDKGPSGRLMPYM